MYLALNHSVHNSQIQNMKNYLVQIFANYTHSSSFTNSSIFYILFVTFIIISTKHLVRKQ